MNIIKKISLLLTFTATCVAVNAQSVTQKPEYLSKTNPGKLIRDFDTFYLNGTQVKTYHMMDILPLNDYYSYDLHRKLYKTSEYVAFAGIVSAFAGGTMVCLNKTFPDKVDKRIGTSLAIAGAVMLTVSIPLDYYSQGKLRKITRRYNETH